MRRVCVCVCVQVFSVYTIVALRYVHCLLHSFSELLAFLSSFPLGCAMFMELSARRTLPSIPHATALPFKSTHWRWMAFAVDRKYLSDVAVMRYASLALSTRDLFDCHIKCCSYPKWLYPFPIPSRIIGSIRNLWCHKKSLTLWHLCSVDDANSYIDLQKYYCYYYSRYRRV